MNSIFKKLHHEFESDGLAASLSVAEATLRSERRFHELFEVLKMKSRHEVGLPLLPDDDQKLPEETQRRLEEGLLQACRDVGFLLLQEGQIQDSWFYLRHLNENDGVLAELNKLEATEDNFEQLIGLLLHEGLDCEAGYRLVLKHYGTCNAITTMQQTMYGRSKSVRQAAGRLLVAHVYDELVENVRGHIEREEAAPAPKQGLGQLIEDRDYLFSDGSYHIDTSHLSSTVQIANELVDASSIQLAQEMTGYGQRLDQGLQYPGDPPFENLYAAHAKFFSAQLGINVDEAVEFFRERAERTDAHTEGTFAIEVYIDLLARLGRPDEAIQAANELIPTGIQTTGRAPSFYELSEQLGDFRRYRELCSERGDMLGFIVSLGK